MNKDALKVIVTDGLGNFLTDEQVQEYQLYFKKKNEIDANPKLKAQELIDDANQILTSYDDIRLKGKHFEISKRFALMTVKEIRGCINWNHYPLDKQWIFWDEVKQEIEKMPESYPYQDKANEFKDNDTGDAYIGKKFDIEVFSKEKIELRIKEIKDIKIK